MAMRADDGLVDVRNTIEQHLESVIDFAGRRISNRVGDIDRGRAGIDCRLDNAAEKVVLCPTRILGRKLDIVTISYGPLHTRHD